MNEIQLTKNIRAMIRHSCPVKEGTDIWRVIVSFISDYPDKNRTIKDYFIWVTGEYLEDEIKLSANIKSAEKFALEFSKKRFRESDNQVPVENGVSCSNKEGAMFVDPREFVQPEEK